VPLERTVVVAAQEHVRQIRTQLPRLPRGNLVVEPGPRGTAACLALVAEHIAGLDPRASMAVFPADHVITDGAHFRRAVARAFAVAEREGCLVTFGIAPTEPETGYGYIELGPVLDRRPPRAFWVARFHEKPDRATARRYLEGGRHLWNAGVFVWRVDVIRACFARHARAVAAAARAVVAAGARGRAAVAARRRYSRLPAVSVDVAILERADRVVVIEGRFGWSDVGSWAAIGKLWSTDAGGNASRGPVVLVDSRDTVVWGGKRLIATVGVEDLVVVDAADALLVCRKSEAQAVRKLIDRLRRSPYRHLL